MAGWAVFSKQAPELAAFGSKRLGDDRVAYLGTVRADGGPRVHPVTPILGEQLFLFMEPTSPKGKDLQRDPRYTLHCAVEDSNGGKGEFYVRGQAQLVQDPERRAEAVAAAPYDPAERYILFVLSVEFAFMNVYEDGEPNPQRWRAPG
ncbi:MAG: pyridoxamine 5'-phosphate oxidase family protein [Anaerolineales bacterium]|nr:pyridoxamine 5'-phosphate oxidase family protein [Anaerolineales bacterium]